ncbi:MAG: hypothetical protein RL026_777 [Pseudomonadota bacterium]
MVRQLAAQQRLVRVDAAALRKSAGYLLAGSGVLLGLASLALLARSTENSAAFGQWQPLILLFNACGVLALAVALARQIWHLVKDYRRQVPGSRLTVRTVGVFGALVVGPLLIVYLFALVFLSRGIDSWFRVEIKQGLGDAVVLSRASLDLRLREQGRRIEEFAAELGNAEPIEWSMLLEAERRRTGALELLLFGRNGEVLAFSADGLGGPTQLQAPPELLLQVADGSTFLSLEPQSAGGYLSRVAAPLPGTAGPGRVSFVLALYDVPQQFAALADAVQAAYSQYGELSVLREPLKNSFRLTLTMVLLLTLLVAIYLAIFAAQRLMRPVQGLIEGTRAVGKGDFDTRLPLPSHDELGYLVHSFNDMTKRLRRTSEEATRSRLSVEQQRERLAVILARLSTGVMVLDPQLRLQIVNEAAGSILGTPRLAAGVGEALSLLGGGPSERLNRFVYELSVRLGTGHGEWREQFELPPDRVLRCACAPLDELAGAPGYVIVFDDITDLLRAQREAAWGEVARRLAHEIKNPLTPIQLSAERLRHRLQGKLPGEEAELLERSTHTIVQQVEAMKGMVNAFSQYARAPEPRLADCDLNALVMEVAELYRSQDGAVDIRVQLDPALGLLRADRERLRQVLNNLVTNSLEALGDAPGRWVEVATQRLHAARGDEVVLTVTDNGYGIQEEMLARVFDPYVTSKQKGTGLGLAIVKKIVEEHHGWIQAENRPEGGARLRVVLPVAAGEGPVALQRFAT